MNATPSHEPGTVRLHRTLPAPPAAVYRAFLEPDQIRRWYGPAEFRVIDVEADVRVGGRLRIVAHGPDGTRGSFECELRELVPAERIGMTWRCFRMHMHADGVGDYRMDNVVVEYVLDRRLAWEPVTVDAEAATALGLGPRERVGQRWSYLLEPRTDGGTRVTETYDCRNASPAVRGTVDDGSVWTDAMAASLGRLEELAAR